jgi:hypothetical protein
MANSSTAPGSWMYTLWDERRWEGSVEMGQQGAGHSRYRIPSPLYWYLMWPTLPLFLFLYTWVFSTGGSVCSHLLTLVPRSRIFLPWRWRRYVPPKCRFKQDLHGVTSQRTAFFIATAMKTSNLTSLILLNCAFYMDPYMCIVFIVAWYD